MGQDQKQHIELTRDIAQRFNHIYGDTFVVPEPIIRTRGARIMGLDDPLAKMSKSEQGSGHAILLTDDESVIRKTLKRATTDSGRTIAFSEDPEKAGVNNLLTIYQLLTGRTRAEVEDDFANARGYGDLKQAVADVVVEALAPVRSAYLEYRNDPAELDRILEAGARRARATAEAKLVQIKERMGMPVPADLT